jgi:ABC-2 type transport system ATP-binding protein
VPENNEYKLQRSGEAAIQLRGVRKTFGPKVAMQGLDLTIPQGSLHGFIGPNGAGKTTTIRMIMSIIFPDSGEIEVLGKKSAVESKDRIGYLPEERGVYRKMKAGAFLEYVARLKGMDGAGLTATVRKWLERVSLGDCYRKRNEELSKGMQQKVQFIASVIHKPDLIILDEPFSGLDPVNRRLLRELIEEQHKAGRTVIFSTHSMFEAEQLCTHLFMIHKGEKKLDGPVDEIWRTYDPRTVHIVPASGGERGADLFTGWPGVRTVRKSGDGYDLLLDDSADSAALMRRAATEMPVRKVEVKRASLEDIFISLSGGDAAVLEAEKEQLEPQAAVAGRR